jgi:Tfp pilus assembly protein FimT
MKFLSKNKGFTLLEICIVVFIIVLFMGMSIPMLSTVYEEQRLRDPAQQLKLFARTARRQAVDEQQLYEIDFSDKGFTLNTIQTDAKTGKSKAVQVLSYSVPSSVTLSVQRWNAKNFVKPANEKWIFQPSGLLEPLHVRFESRKSWLEFTFHPLTAAAMDETFNFQT